MIARVLADTMGPTPQAKTTVTPGCFWHSGGVVISNKVRFFHNSRESLERADTAGTPILLYKI